MQLASLPGAAEIARDRLQVMLQLEGVEFLTRHVSHLMRTRRRRQPKGTHQCARASPVPATIAIGPMTSRAPADSLPVSPGRALPNAPDYNGRATATLGTSLHTKEATS